MAKQFDGVNKTNPEVSIAVPEPTGLAVTEQISAPKTNSIAEPTVEPQESYTTFFPEPTVVIKSPPSWIWWAVLLIISLLVGIAGYQLVRSRTSELLSEEATPSIKTITPSPSVSTSTPNTSTTPVASSAPTSSQTPVAVTSPSGSQSVTPATVTLRILNGTSTNGLASTLKAEIEKSGFKVRELGNTKTQDYPTTIIYYQKGKLAEAQAVKDAITSYTATLEESTLANPDMVLVVIGKK